MGWEFTDTVSSAISGAAFCLSVLNFVRAERQAQKDFSSEFSTDVTTWATEAIGIFHEAATLEGDVVTSDLIQRASTIRDRGFLLFPSSPFNQFEEVSLNQDYDEIYPAYRGKPAPIMVPILELCRFLNAKNRTKYADFEGNAQPTLRITPQREKFVSIVQVVIRTRDRYAQVGLVAIKPDS